MILDKNLREGDMKTNVEGRIRNLDLPVTKPLIPIFEAITNSIQAIADAEEKNGYINIRVLREKELSDSMGVSISGNKSTPQIIGFNIEDNGIGFTNANLDSFNRLDSDYKNNRGGKGVGRLSYLKVFEQVNIESTYIENNAYNRRNITFVQKGKSVDVKLISEVDAKDRFTTVKMQNVLVEPYDYYEYMPKTPVALINDIIEHFFDYLLNDSSLQIRFYDDLTPDTVYDINKVFRDSIYEHSNDIFHIENTEFCLANMRIKTTIIPDHRIYFSADNRTVTFDEKVFDRVPNISKRLCTEDEEEFIYVGIVTSSYLNTYVNSTRDGFSFPKEDGFTKNLLGMDRLSSNKIKDEVLEHIKTYLKPYTDIAREKKIPILEEYIRNNEPYLISIKDNIMSDADTIDCSSPEKIANRINEIQRLRASNIASDLAALKDNKHSIDILKRVEELQPKILEENRINLSRYMTQRYAVIDLFYDLCDKKNHGYLDEHEVHELIYPRSKDSDKISYLEHYLWLIDDRLSFYNFCTSDIALRKTKGLSSASSFKPDVALYKKRFVTDCSKMNERCNVTFIEFKKPMRDDYTAMTDPVKQVIKYVNKIRETQHIEIDGGRPIPLNENTAIVCYIICDITDSLKALIRDNEYNCRPDGNIYHFHKNGNILIETMSFDDIYSDSEKRHKIFFEMLGINKMI